MSTLPKNANKSYQHLKTFFYLLDGSTKSVNGRFPKKAIKFEKKYSTCFEFTDICFSNYVAFSQYLSFTPFYGIPIVFHAGLKH